MDMWSAIESGEDTRSGWELMLGISQQTSGFTKLSDPESSFHHSALVKVEDLIPHGDIYGHVEGKSIFE
jgi:hypothetical protein